MACAQRAVTWLSTGEAAAHQLLPTAEPRPDLFVRVVDALNGAPDEEGRMQGSVTLSMELIYLSTHLRQTGDAPSPGKRG